MSEPTRIILLAKMVQLSKSIMDKEVARASEYFASRDSHVRYTAYVPPGSIALGKLLAMTGCDGRTVACRSCHGADLKGTGVATAIIARSPSYVVRQLFDIQAGNRSGADAAMMKPAVDHFDPDGHG